jgi:hypothetical protein
MVEQPSTSHDSESDDAHTPVHRDPRVHRANAKPHTDFPKLACKHSKSQRNKLRQRARDDKFAALIGTY